VKGLAQKGCDVYLVSLSDVIEYEYVHDLPITFEIIQKKDKDFSLIFKLRKVIRSFQPDIIHSWDVMSSGYLIAANLFYNKPLINGVIYDAALDSNYYNRHPFKVRLFAHLSKATIANSKAGLLAYKTPASKSHCIYNGIDLKRFDNLKPATEMETSILGAPKGDRFIGTMVASFSKWKDHITLLNAAIKLCTFNSKFVLLLIGEGPEKAAMQRMVPDNLLNKQIFFLGSRSDVESILQITDAGLLITPREGLSNSIIEYMASGKPVIASKGGGTAELVNDGQTGFLVEQKDSEGIIRKLEILMNDAKLCQEMGQKGKQWVKENLEASRMSDAYFSLYEKHLPAMRMKILKTAN
jgi:glycosyltransferase involved in cell wall biosynthesis